MEKTFQDTIDKERKIMKNIRTNYQHTIYASYLGYITQAIVNNFAPLLFLTFQTTYHLSLRDITLITTVHFFVQLCVDLLCAKVIDHIGYRVAIVAAHFFAYRFLTFLVEN